MAEITSLREAVAELVNDGCQVAMEGFTHLIPFAAGHEVIRQGKRVSECFECLRVLKLAISAHKTI